LCARTNEPPTIDDSCHSEVKDTISSPNVAATVSMPPGFANVDSRTLPVPRVCFLINRNRANSLRRHFHGHLFLVLAIVNGLFCARATAQFGSATLAGQILESATTPVAGARVTLIDIDRAFRISTVTGPGGYYTFPDVTPGRYRMEVTAAGFMTLKLTGLEIYNADTIKENLPLTRRSASDPDAVSLEAETTPIQNSGTVSTLIDRTLVTELPLNGRSFQTLFQLTPGVVITPTSFASLGQFSVNGQRTDTNYFLIDGVSANFGISAAANPGQSSGGSLPALTAFGGTNSLVSVDDVQEFAILTSSFAPEYGRTPGGQISITTRSGTNAFHGNLFDFVRNEALDANDWLANQHHLRRSALRQNDFGGVLGGPIRKDKAFFFISYEGLQLRQPTISESDVPSVAARQSAPASMQPFFNAYPLPNGTDEGNGLAPAIYAFSDPLSLETLSIRVDQHFGEALAIFGRYNNSVSDQKLRGATVTSLSSVTDLKFPVQTLTAGSTWSIKPQITNDTRLNWSTSSAAFFNFLDGFAGAIPLSTANAFPFPYSDHNSLFQFVPDLTSKHPDLKFGRNASNLQSQINLLDTLSWTIRAHSPKVGTDLRTLRPRIQSPLYAQESLFDDISTALMGKSQLSIVQAFTGVQSTFWNASLFAQDTWRPTARLSVTYGTRWDFNPAPTGHGDNGLTPFAVQGISNLPTLALRPPKSALYRATANNFAPRLGLAYGLRTLTGTEMVIKAGAGIFYDFGNSLIGNAFAGEFFPFSAENVLNGASFPLSPSDATPPSITTDPPFAQIAGFPSVVRLPYTYHWNASIEQSIGASQTLTLGYLGSAGHRLWRSEEYRGGEAGVPQSFVQLLFTTNGGYSNYNALQAQVRRRAARGPDIVASYTLSHSLDNVSTDAFLQGVPGRLLNPRSDYASSDFDVRHTAAVALDYRLPAPNCRPKIKPVFSEWTLSPILTFRSAPPINVVVSRDLGFGTYPFRPDFVPGRPLYIAAANVAGAVRINPAAFSVPAQLRQGDLGRNRLHGFPLSQIDLAVRRTFRVTDNLEAQVRIEAFNLFNHPNFAPEAGVLGAVDSLGTFFPQSGFGVSSGMLANGLQTEGPGSGFSPLYQMGRARSLQAALKLQF
jgi:Carboxypeptidase regulatory-like domain/TonB-dependent Receptor Plug Domain